MNSFDSPCNQLKNWYEIINNGKKKKKKNPLVLYTEP